MPATSIVHVDALPSTAERRAVEWPTWALLVAVYAAWLLAAAVSRRYGVAWGTAPLALATCWYMSLQHELLHGHPTRHAAVNRLFGPGAARRLVPVRPLSQRAPGAPPRRNADPARRRPGKQRPACG